MTEAEILKLGPFKPGNVVVVSGDWNDCHNAVAAIHATAWPDDATLGEDGWPFVVPLVVIGPATLEVADEQLMNKAGWYRRDQG